MFFQEKMLLLFFLFPIVFAGTGSQAIVIGAGAAGLEAARQVKSRKKERKGKVKLTDMNFYSWKPKGILSQFSKLAPETVADSTL